MEDRGADAHLDDEHEIISQPTSPRSFESWEEPLYSRPFFDDVEEVEDYTNGGFHPIHLRDKLGPNNRYKVLHKLGYGGLATVWLCRDTQSHSYKAVKINKAHASKQDSPELKLMRRKDLDFMESGGQYIALPEDHFWMQGPNGTHLCFVLPVLGPPVSAIWHSFSEPEELVQNLCFQMTKGLHFLHKNQICHGDFRPSNILLRLANIDHLTDEQLFNLIGEPETEPVFTATGETPGVSVPKYLVKPIEMSWIDPEYFTKQACIIDFGESFNPSNPPLHLGIPGKYRSPELIFEDTAGLACDLWAFACTIFELRTYHELFEPWGENDDPIISEIVRLLGKLPEPWWSAWDKRKNYFEEDGASRISKVSGTPISPPTTIVELLAYGVHFGITASNRKIDIVVPLEEQVVLGDFLLQFLRYDPESRAAVEDMLDHPWFTYGEEKYKEE